jgi:hypothetical protein
MALQIASFDVRIIPTNFERNVPGPTMPIDLIIPTEKDVIVKKIICNCVFSSPSNVIISDYSINFLLLHRDRINLSNNNLLIINPISGFINSNQLIGFTKKSNSKLLNIKIGGLRFINSNFGSFLLNNNNFLNTDNVIFKLSIYYEV